MSWACLVLVGLICGACGGSVVHVHALDPRPELTLPQRDHTVRLELAPAIAEAVSIPAQSGTSEIRVHSWRQTLARGFGHGFAAYAGSGGRRVEWSLVLERADLSLRSAATGAAGDDTAMLRAHGPMQAHGGPHMKAHRPPRKTFSMRLDYQARLVNASGQTMAQTSGAVQVQLIVRGDSHSIETAIQSAVESLYQALATELITSNSNHQQAASNQQQAAISNQSSTSTLTAHAATARRGQSPRRSGCLPYRASCTR